jgi:hypothetical protein
MSPPLTVGAVAYHPRVETIWDSFVAWFAARGSPIAPVLFDSYDEQLEALFGGHIDVAWNTNLAYVEAQRRAGGGCGMLAMRDNDRDWRSHAVVRADSDIHELGDLAGTRIGFASSDSSQATILPIYFMRLEGLDPDRDAQAERLELDVGKHGDTGGAEREQLARLSPTLSHNGPPSSCGLRQPPDSFGAGHRQPSRRLVCPTSRPPGLSCVPLREPELRASTRAGPPVMAIASRRAGTSWSRASKSASRHPRIQTAVTTDRG